MSLNTTYNAWYIRADQAWTIVADLEQEQAQLCNATFAEVVRYEELSIEIKEWKEAAEFAEKQMSQMEQCLNVRVPNYLFIPNTPEEIIHNEIFTGSTNTSSRKSLLS